LLEPLLTLTWGEEKTQVFAGVGLLGSRQLWESLIPRGSAVAVVADAGVAERWLPILLRKGLDDRKVLPAILPGGESTKSREFKEAVEDLWIYYRLGRKAVTLALGGGVIGDLTGFTAGTYLRGIPHIQIPTTLLAMVDSSLGGKTGVDHPLGKNLIGIFHPATAIVADIETLSTLPDKIFRHGIIEGIKHAIIYDRDFFEWIEKNIVLLLKRDTKALLNFVVKNLRIKGEVVEKDPYENDLRQILNFGHTIGHALEQASRYALFHAEAVAVGILCELKLAEARLGFSSGEKRRIYRVLQKVGVFPDPTFLRNLDPEDILDAMGRDKKVREGEIRFSLPRRIGEYPPIPSWGYTIPVGREEIVDALFMLKELKSFSG
jgi:3-dehydroquinate synthase